ncbi:hypothetical protein V1477_010404, partial [Vespula maculifrons]
DCGSYWQNAVWHFRPCDSSLASACGAIRTKVEEEKEGERAAGQLRGDVLRAAVRTRPPSRGILCCPCPNNLSVGLTSRNIFINMNDLQTSSASKNSFASLNQPNEFHLVQ